MRAVLLGLAALIAVAFRPGHAAGGATSTNGACQSVRVTEELLLEDIKISHGEILVLSSTIAVRYIEAISLPAPSDGFGAVLIYKGNDITAIGYLTPDMQSACQARLIPTRLHLKALRRVNSTPA